VAAFFCEQKSADHSGKRLRFGPERERRADQRGHLLDRKSGSAACLLVARGSRDRQAGGHSRFARAEQRSATTTSSAAWPSTPTAIGAGSSTSSNVSPTKASSNPYPPSHNAFSAQPVLAGIGEVSGRQASCRLLLALPKEKSSIFVITA
jgi:hypothetical protein